MKTQSIEDIVLDESYVDGFNAAKKTISKKLSAIQSRAQYVYDTFAGGGTDPNDDCMVALREIIQKCSN